MKTEQTETTNDIRHSFTILRGDEKTVIKIKLNDECKNGHEDFSLTADIYEKTPRGWRDVGGGCCHEHILKLKPELAPFAALHLSDVDGVPMHAASNAWYWLQGAFPEAEDKTPNLGPCHGSAKSPEECRRIFAEHIRATPEQVEQIAAKMPRSQTELQATLEDLGFPEQWKHEAEAAVRQLEEWTGKKFESRAIRQCWKPLSAEARADIAHKRASGYYTPEAVAKRDAETREAAKQKKLASLRASYEASCAKLKRSLDVESHLIEKFGSRLNFIYYDHTNELEANWTNTEKLLTKPEFDAITQALDYSRLPQGIKTVWKERPRY
jgi:hypothetical protein